MMTSFALVPCSNSFSKSIGPGFDRPHCRQPNRSPYGRDYRDCVFEIKRNFWHFAQLPCPAVRVVAGLRPQPIVGGTFAERKGEWNDRGSGTTGGVERQGEWNDRRARSGRGANDPPRQGPAGAARSLPPEALRRFGFPRRRADGTGGDCGLERQIRSEGQLQREGKPPSPVRSGCPSASLQGCSPVELRCLSSCHSSAGSASSREPPPKTNDLPVTKSDYKDGPARSSAPYTLRMCRQARNLGSCDFE